MGIGGRRAAMVGVALLSVAALVGCGREFSAAPAPRTAPTPTSRPAPLAGATTGPSPRRVEMVPWRQPVEELFVHPLVLDPALAFTDDRLGRGFQDYFVTDREFGALLDQLWRNGWILVDIHRVVDGTVRVPAGRKPLVLVEDDVNYYRYFEGRGLAAGLVLGADGRVHARLDDGTLTDEDVVPMVEAALATPGGTSTCRSSPRRRSWPTPGAGGTSPACWGRSTSSSTRTARARHRR